MNNNADTATLEIPTSTGHAPALAARICIVAITKHGVQQAAKLAHQLPNASLCTSAKFAGAFSHLPNTLRTYQGALKDEISLLWKAYEQIIFFVSLGAVVRLIAPHLQSKDTDPGILVVDEAAQFVIPVLSGHIGGANAYSQYISGLLGATPVVTTASDVGNTIAVDILGRELGWTVQAPKINITRVSAAVVSASAANGERIAVVQDAGSRRWWTRTTALPAHIDLFEHFDQACPTRHAAVLWITQADIPPSVWEIWHERLVVYRPPQGQTSNAQASSTTLHCSTPRQRYALGLGCDRNTPLATMQQAIAQALLQINASLSDVAAVASIDLKADEPCMLELQTLHRWNIAFYPASVLATVAVPNPSTTVQHYTGTPSVSEAAALLAAGVAGQPASVEFLCLEKYKLRGEDGRNATVSIAKITPPKHSPNSF